MDLEGAGLARNDLLVRALSDFARALVQRFDISDVLYDLTTRVTAVLEVASAGVSLGQGGRQRFVTALDERTASLERVQEDNQAGPCIEAFRTGQPFLISSFDQVEERWPAFVKQARAVGLASAASISMRLNGESLGTLDVYHTSPRDWSVEDVGIARVLADIASGYVATASALERQRRTTQQLQRALDSRVIIEQAKGIIAAERKITVDEAFGVLRDHARSHNAHLRSVAEAVINLGLRP